MKNLIFREFCFLPTNIKDVYHKTEVAILIPKILETKRILFSPCFGYRKYVDSFVKNLHIQGKSISYSSPRNYSYQLNPITPQSLYFAWLHILHSKELDILLLPHTSNLSNLTSSFAPLPGFVPISSTTSPLFLVSYEDHTHND